MRQQLRLFDASRRIGCGWLTDNAWRGGLQVINRDLSILAIRVFDRWRRRDMKKRDLRAGYIKTLTDKGIAFDGVYPETIEV